MLSVTRTFKEHLIEFVDVNEWLIVDHLLLTKTFLSQYNLMFYKCLIGINEILTKTFISICLTNVVYHFHNPITWLLWPILEVFFFTDVLLLAFTFTNFMFGNNNKESIIIIISDSLKYLCLSKCLFITLQSQSQFKRWPLCSYS